MNNIRNNFRNNNNNNDDPAWRREKLLYFLIGILVIVVVGLIIFRGESSDDNNALHDRIEELIKESQLSMKRADSLELEVGKYKEISKEFKKKDSLKNIQIEKQKAETRKLKIQQERARKDRERVQKELEDFKNNPPKHTEDGELPLLFDTRKRINDQKSEGGGDGNE